MKTRALVLIVLASLASQMGCQGVAPSDGRQQPGLAADRTISDGYSLLYSTLDDESQVDKVLMIKGPAEQVAQLLRDIAKFATEGKAKLDEFAKQDATLVFKNSGLPRLETETRGLIAGSKSKEILFSAGRNFEFNILLSQHEALNYIDHLGQALGKNDKNEARRKFSEETAATAKALHERVMEQLKTPYVVAGK